MRKVNTVKGYCVYFFGLILFPILIFYNSSVAQSQNLFVPSPTPLGQWPPPTVTPSPPANKPLPTFQKNEITTASNAREYLQVPFTAPGGVGVNTTQEYSGTVIVSVSGGGQSAGVAYNDAFYLYLDENGNNISPAYIAPFYLYVNYIPARDLIGFLPLYREDHTYSFFINAGSTPQHLNFAIGDTYTVDNDGSFTVALSDPQQPFVLTDTDEDGIWDYWETNGIDVDNDGSPDYILPEADPNRKNIYLEIDWLQAANHDHKPQSGVIDAIKQAFAKHDIIFHAEVSQAGIVETSDLLSICWRHLENVTETVTCPTGTTDFDQLKETHFADPLTSAKEIQARKLIYHYVILGHNPYVPRPGCNPVTSPPDLEFNRG